MRSNNQNTSMQKLVCVRVLDPKNVGSKTEYTVVRVHRNQAIDLINQYGVKRAKFVAKHTYKNFIKTVENKHLKGAAVNVGLTRQEIRHCGIIKKEQAITARNKAKFPKAKQFAFPIYLDENSPMLTSDLNEFEREQKDEAGVLNKGNNRKRTDSRKGNSAGNYVYGGFRVHANNSNYQKVAQASAMQQHIKAIKVGDKKLTAEPVEDGGITIKPVNKE